MNIAFRHVRRAATLFVLLLLTIRETLGEVVALNTEVVEMPPFVITESPSGVRWKYASVPGFEILSQCSQKDTQLVVDALYRGRILTLPADLRPRLSVPTLVILFNQKPDGVAGMKALGNQMNSGDAFAHWNNVIKRTLPDSEIFCLNLYGGKLRYTSVFRYDMRTVLNLHTPAFPDWFRDALFGPCGIYNEDINYSPGADTVKLFRAWGWDKREMEEIELLMNKMKAQAAGGKMGAGDLDVKALSPVSRLLAPMDKIWQMKSRKSIDDDGDHASATAALFARWALFADGGAHFDAFWRFAKLSRSEQVTEKNFRAHFGMGYEQMQITLSWFIPVAATQSAIYKVSPPVLPVVTLRDAAPVEVARIRGEWEREEAHSLAANFPQLGAVYRKHAGARLRGAIGHHPNDGSLQAVAGLYEYDVGNMKAARPLLETAAKAGAVRPLAYLRLAQCRLSEFELPANEVERALNQEQVAHVMEPLAVLHGALPQMAATYDVLIDVWTRSERDPDKAVRQYILRGVREFPRDARLALRTAEFLRRRGFFREAKQACTVGLEFADGVQRERLEALSFELKSH